MNYTITHTSNDFLVIKTAEQGIEQVTNNNPADYVRLLSFARQWLRNRKEQFTAEDLKSDFFESNDPVRNYNIFGAVFRTLRNEGLISIVGYKKSKMKMARGREIRIYVANNA